MSKFEGKIRTTSMEDLPAVKKILSAWLSSEEVIHYLGFIEDSIAHATESLIYDSNYLVAETKDNEIVGVLGYRKPIPKIIQFTSTENPAELNMLYVSPEKRGGHGIGTALVNEMEKNLKTKKYTEIVIRSAKRFEEVGWGFYDKLPGFKRVGLMQQTSDNEEESQIWHKII